MKKLNLLFTALLLMCCVGTAKAVEVTIDGIKYDVITDTKQATVIKDSNYSGNIVIPSEITYNNVTCSVTNIGSSAFEDCDGLTSITIPNSVTSIGYRAFSWCSGLTSITIPNSVASIEYGAFRYCYGLKKVINFSNLTFAKGSSDYGYIAHYADNVYNDPNGSIESDYIFCKLNNVNTLVGYLGSETELTLPADYKGESYVIDESAFEGNNTITSITIPNSVTSIGNQAFYGCEGLTSITIPNSVTSIGEEAFYNCKGLTSITIHNSVTSIGSYAFAYCSGLTSITIPNCVTSIGEDAFIGCSGLESIVVDKGNTTYDSRENCNAIIETESNALIAGCKNTVIPNSVTSIGEDAFYYCDGLTSITIPNSVTSIGEDAFQDCSGLTSITIPNSVTSIGEDAFSDCDGLKEVHINDIVAWCNINFGAIEANPLCYADNFYLNGGIVTNLVIPDGVTEIKDYAFIGCPSLKSIEIPNSVTSIGNYAFVACTGLTSITIPNSVTSIGYGAFYGCSGLTSITIPNSVTSIGEEAFYNCKGLKEVYNFSNLTFAKGSSDYGYIAYYADNVYNVPNGSIEGDYIFGKLNNVNTLVGYLGSETELTLPADYKGESYVIDESAFEGNNTITSITIPNSVTSIGNQAFYGCEGLTSITIPNSVTSIGSYAFAYCSGLTSITIPNSVASIGSYAFAYCSGLTSITIPNSVTSIGYGAFSGCENIETLYISNAIESIGENAFAGCKKIKEIKIGLEKPIRCNANIFADAVYDNATLYIPNGTKSLYDKREPWNLFFDIAETDFTGIDDIEAENGNVKTIYDLQGRRVENPTNGIYIVNGKKIFIK